MDVSHSILRFAKQFFAGTLLSRISGALRDMAMAFCFGAAPEIAAFMVAYRLANFFRRLFGEGNVQAGFIPHFEGLEEKEAFRFYRDTAFTVLIVLAAAILGIEGLLWGVAQWVDSDWAHIVHLAMAMTPALLFIFLYALNSSLLQTQKSFFIPAAAPVLFNVAWIAAAFLGNIRWLCFGIVVAFALQWLWTALRTRKILKKHLSWREWFRPHLFSPEWKKLLRPLSLGVIGIGALQINALLDSIFARLADPSGPAFLWYALRVQQLPLALFGIALSRALLPPLARSLREGDLEQYRSLLQNSLRHGAALMIPCTFALFALGSSGLNLLFGRGDFTSADVVQTVGCLEGYGWGLLPSVFVLFFANGFYAKKEYAVPAAMSLVSVGINALLNALFIFVFHWGAVSVAIATSLSAFANAGLLFYCLRRRIGSIFPPFFWNHLSCFVLAGAIACAAALLAEHWMCEGLSRKLHEQLFAFCLAAAVYLGSFLAVIRALGLWESVAVFLKKSSA